MSGRVTLTVIVDCGAAAGYGRFQRCTAVAQALNQVEDIDVRYLLPDECHVDNPPGVNTTVTQLSNVSVHSIREAVHPGDGPLLIDTSQLDESSLQQLRLAGYFLVQFDDDRRFEHYSASLVINSSLAALSTAYSGEPDSVFLLGPDYFPLRQEFAQAVARETQPQAARRLLLAFGGADPDDVTAKVFNVVRNDPFWTGIAVILGPGYQGELTPDMSEANRITVVRNPDTCLELARHADLAICSAGMMAWEFAWIGVPMLLLVARDDQLLAASTFDDSKAAVMLGRIEEFDAEWLQQALEEVRSDQLLRQMIAANAMGLIDGGGAHRIAQEISLLLNQRKNR